jgi:hypothetical protein
MSSTLSFTLSTGRVVEIGLRAADGSRLKVAEVFEVIRHCGHEAGEFGREVAMSAQSDALAKSLRSIVTRSASGMVRGADLVARLRLLHRELTPRQIEKLLPRLMTLHYGHGRSNDIPGLRGEVRGYRGITIKKKRS